MASFVGELELDGPIRHVSTCTTIMTVLTPQGACTRYSLSQEHPPRTLVPVQALSACVVDATPPVVLVLTFKPTGMHLVAFDGESGDPLALTLPLPGHESPQPPSRQGVRLPFRNDGNAQLFGAHGSWLLALVSHTIPGALVWKLSPNETMDRTAVFELALTCETQFHSPMCITRKVLVAVAPGERAVTSCSLEDRAGGVCPVDTIELPDSASVCAVVSAVRPVGEMVAALCEDSTMYLLSTAGKLVQLVVPGVQLVRDIALVSDGSAAGRISVLGSGRTIYLCDGGGLEQLNNREESTEEDVVKVECVGAIMNEQCVVSLDGIQPDCVLALSENSVSFWLL